MNYIYYQTKTKFINTGDALINNALLSVLRDYGVLRCNCSAEIPNYFIDELGIKEEEKYTCNNELSFAINIIKGKIISKKNDNFYLFSGLGHHFGSSKKKIIRNYIAGLIIFPLYKLLGIKIIRIGFSIGPFSKSLGRSEKIRSIFIDEYLVRDQNSLDLAYNLNIKKAKQCPDMSWMYLMSSKRKINETNTITICLRNSMFDDDDIEYESKLIKRLDSVLECINTNVKNMKLIFIYQVEEDRGFTFELYKKYQKKYECTYIEDQIRLSSAQKYYSKSLINISNRMHSILLSYKYGALPIALTDLNSHKKISQTLCDCKFEEIGVDINSKESILPIITNRKEILNHMFTIEENNQKKVLTILNKIFEKSESDEEQV